jgi:succinate dehydrogenase / fumarate reductase cytochrome b subunit
VLFYFVGVSAATFHFANGIWNFLIKWGITVGERAQKYSGYICALIALGVYVYIITSLYAFTR